RMLVAFLWVCIGSGILVLLIAAARRKDAERCTGIYINIHGVSNNFFVDKKDILNSITHIVGGDPVGEAVSGFNLKMMETGLTTNIWVKSAQLFFDNNEVLQVKVLEREPVARIFTSAGTTFYIDSSIYMLPLSEKFSARLPVFTNFPSDKPVLSKADSNLLRDIKKISLAVQNDSFSMAMIDQIDITSQRTFEMIPKMGTQVIVFGDAKDIQEKLRKLQLFYKEVQTKAGWNYYSTIDLQYKSQVVAKIKGVQDKVADSLRTLQLMQFMAMNAQKHAEDSLRTIVDEAADSSIVLQSMQREEEGADLPNTIVAPLPIAKPATITPAPLPAKPIVPVVAPVVKPVVVTPAKPVVPAIVKPAVLPKAVVIAPAKPKPVMPKPIKPKPATEKNNDY
ncbi:MAG: hypothetical protein HY305_07135, partial [Sphingobacteriales bacterium]|nr:hypothetical protein [Sphingobacteriales bacterium]